VRARVFVFETRHSFARRVCAKFSLFSLHKHNAVRGEFSHVRCCAAVVICYKPPSTAGLAGTADRCEKRRHFRRLALELVNARNCAHHHPVGRAFDSALDLEACKVRKLTAVMVPMHGISDVPELSVSSDLY
jgi:hypothetical protein